MTKPPSSIALAQSDEDIRRCFPFMLELRPHLVEAEFVARVRAQQRESGYRLAFIADESSRVACVAGFRVASFLAWGRTLYIDDLSTCADARRRGHGGRMLDWIFALAEAEKCEQVHLDSGVHRHDAHRLYLNKRFLISSHHFSSDRRPSSKA